MDPNTAPIGKFLIHGHEAFAVASMYNTLFNSTDESLLSFSRPT